MKYAEYTTNNMPKLPVYLRGNLVRQNVVMRGFPSEIFFVAFLKAKKRSLEVAYYSEAVILGSSI